MVDKNARKLVNRIKERFPDIKIAVMGDHVTSFPEESLENSRVDLNIGTGWG